MILIPEIVLYSLLHDVQKVKRMLPSTKAANDLTASINNTVKHIELMGFTHGLETEQEFFDSLTIMDGETGEILRIKVPEYRNEPYEVHREA